MTEFDDRKKRTQQDPKRTTATESSYLIRNADDKFDLITKIQVQQHKIEVL
jgi:hypothetical protein